MNFASTLIADAPRDPNVAVTNAMTTSDAPYDCSGQFVYLAGELTSPHPLISTGGAARLTAIVQPI